MKIKIWFWILCAFILISIFSIWKINFDKNNRSDINKKNWQEIYKMNEIKVKNEGYSVDNLPDSVKYFKYIDSFQMDGENLDIFPTESGFMIPNNGRPFIMHSWKDGHILWKVNEDKGSGWWSIPGGAWENDNNSSFAVSESGEYLAVSTIEDDGIHVRCWKNGKRYNDFLVVTLNKKNRSPVLSRVAITEEGQCLLWYYFSGHDDEKKLLIIKKNRIVAKCKLTKEILSGGVLAVDGYEYGLKNNLYRIEIKDSQVIFKRISNKVLPCEKFPGNYLFSENGAVYNEKGLLHKPDSLYNIEANFKDKMINGWTTQWRIFQRKKNVFEIFSIVDKKKWYFSGKDNEDAVAVSANGKFVLTHEYGERPMNSKDEIWLYEYPDIQRAVLRYDYEETVPFDGGRVVGQGCYNWILSPDGQSVILKYQYMGIGGTARLYHVQLTNKVPMKNKQVSKMKWLNYSGQSVDELISLESEYRTDSLVIAVEDAILNKSQKKKLSAEELVILAVEALEREVNNGGYNQFFLNPSGKYTPIIVDSLKKIGCPSTAKITESAIHTLGITGNITVDSVEYAISAGNEERDDKLNECDTEFLKYTEDIAESLWKYIKNNKEKIKLP